jgi:hypothetical protein
MIFANFLKSFLENHSSTVFSPQNLN